MDLNDLPFTWEPMQVRLDRVNGTDLDVVNAARRSFGTKSNWLFETESIDPATGEEYIHRGLTVPDRGLLTFLGRGYKRDDYDKLVLDIASAGWRLWEEHHAEDQDSDIYDDKIRALADLMWKWRDEAIHDTPFNHVGAHWGVMIPVFVARQLVKTEYMPWSEISRRYKEDMVSYWKPGLADGLVWREAPEDKKQGSGGPLPPEVQLAMDMSVTSNTMEAHARMQWMLSSGVCMEQARMVLPANLMVEVTWSGFLGATCKMLRERTGSHAQAETRWVAKQMLDLLTVHFPVSVPALVR